MARAMVWNCWSVQSQHRNRMYVWESIFWYHRPTTSILFSISKSKINRWNGILWSRNSIWFSGSPTMIGLFVSHKKGTIQTKSDCDNTYNQTFYTTCFKCWAVTGGTTMAHYLTTGIWCQNSVSKLEYVSRKFVLFRLIGTKCLISNEYLDKTRSNKHVRAIVAIISKHWLFEPYTTTWYWDSHYSQPEPMIPISDKHSKYLIYCISNIEYW